MLDIVMHNVLIFLLVNPPLLACERRSCCCTPEVYSSTNQAENASGAAMRMEKPQSKTPQFKMTSLKCPYLSKPQVIILTVHYIAMKHCTSHKTSTAYYSPAHEYTSSQILHIYGISVVICGGLPTRQAASNHHKPPLKHLKCVGFGMIGIRKSIVHHQHGLATLNES